ARDGRLRRRIAPQNGLVVEGRERNVDALERFDEYRPGAREVTFPAARTKIAVERDFGALRASGFQQREETPYAGVGVERQRDAGEVDEPRRHQALGNTHPVGQFEQVARRCALTPIAEASFASWAVFDKRQARKPARYAQNVFA